MRNARKTILFTLFVFTLATFQSQAAIGNIVTTDELIQESKSLELRGQLAEALERDEVVQMLQKQGITADQAKERVAAMTDAEASQLAAQFDDLPAGGDVVLLLVIIILILLLR